MQKRENRRRKTQKKRGGAPKKSSTPKSSKKRSTLSRMKGLFSASTYESPPATDAKKIERAAKLPMFGMYKNMIIKESNQMPSMVTMLK